MKNALLKNLNWFENSGVMLPNDGLWGVAERVAVVKNNEAIEKMYASFVAWTPHGDYSIIEQRRADCNFETAYLYLLAAEVLKEQKYTDIAAADCCGEMKISILTAAGTGLTSNAPAMFILMMKPGVYSFSWKLQNAIRNWIRSMI